MSYSKLLANIAVIAASGLVAITGSAMPDVIVGLGIAFLSLQEVSFR